MKDLEYMTMEDVRKIGVEVGLNENHVVLFYHFVEEALSSHVVPEYVREWAHRFKKGEEWVRSDLGSRRILQQLAPGMYPKILND